MSINNDLVYTAVGSATNGLVSPNRGFDRLDHHRCYPQYGNAPLCRSNNHPAMNNPCAQSTIDYLDDPVHDCSGNVSHDCHTYVEPRIHYPMSDTLSSMSEQSLDRRNLYFNRYNPLVDAAKPESHSQHRSSSGHNIHSGVGSILKSNSTNHRYPSRPASANDYHIHMNKPKSMVSWQHDVQPSNFDHFRKVNHAQQVSGDERYSALLQPPGETMHRPCAQPNTEYTSDNHSIVRSCTVLEENYKRILELEEWNKQATSQACHATTSRLLVLNDLELKLGASEQEVLSLKGELHEIKKHSDDKLEDLQEKLKDKTEEVINLKGRVDEMTNEERKTKEKLKNLESYMANLQTPDEKEKVQREVDDLRYANSGYKARIEQLTRRVQKSMSSLNDRDRELNDTLRSKEKAEGKLKKLEDEMDRLRSVGDSHLLKISELNLTKARDDRDRLKADLDKAKKVIEMMTRKQHDIELHHSNVITELQGKLLSVDCRSDTLLKEVNEKEDQIGRLQSRISKLKDSLRDVEDEKAAVEVKYRDNIIDQEKTEERSKLESQILQEMTACYRDLKSLVDICIQRVEGRETNISSLLGISVNTSIQENYALPHGELLQSRLDRIKETHKDIDKLRSLICTKFAEELGHKLTCNIQ